MTWNKVEYVCAFLAWCWFFYLMAVEPDTGESIQYLAGMLAASAYMRALRAMEKAAHD